MSQIWASSANMIHDQGVTVPEVLRPYIPGAPDFIPYTKELPKDSTSQKVQGKAKVPQKPKVPPVGAGPEEAAAKMKEMKV